MPDVTWNVEMFDYQPLLGFRFDLKNTVSGDATYIKKDDPDYTIQAPNLWWRQLDIPQSSTYSVFGELGIPTESTDTVTGVDVLNFARFTRTVNNSTETYWMILPEIIDDPFFDFDWQSNPFNGELAPQRISTSPNPTSDTQTYQEIATDEYNVEIALRDQFNRYTLHQMLDTSVECVSGCEQVEIPEPSQVLPLLIIGLLALTRLFKRRSCNPSS